MSDRTTGWRTLGAAALAALLAGCTGGAALEPPPRERVRELVLEALGPGREEPPLRWLAVEAPGPEGPVIRPAEPGELGELFLPPPLADVAIEGLECRRFPIWRVGLRELREGGAPGARLVVEVAPVGEVGAMPGPDADWRLIARRWRAARGADGRLVPDFRPLAEPEQGGELPHVWIVVSPPWVPRGPRVD